jgi:hypothetical protein
MKYVKTFEKFSPIYEAEVAEGEKSPEAEEAKKEVADAVKAETSKKSAFSQKFKAEVEAQKQVETKPEEGKNESLLNEDVAQEGEMLNIENIKKYAKALVPKLPILTAGDKKVRFGYQMTEIPAGAEYEAYNINVSKDQVSINYKDRTGKYKEVVVNYKADEKELQHMKTIFDNMGKKLSLWSKLKNFGTKGAVVLGAVGFLGAVGTMIYQGAHHGSGSEAYRDIPMLVQAGGALIGAAAAVGVATNQISKKFDVANDVFECFTALLKAFIEPLGLKIEEIQTIGDIQTILSSPKVAVEIQDSTTAGAVESVSNSKIKGFDRF